MAETRSWLARYEDEERTKLIATEWLQNTEGEAQFSPGPVTDVDAWTVVNDNGGSWVSGQFVVVCGVERN